ncbi:LlaJI family restriction endonuclease [Glaciecola punicea]|uniref:LlaJI family restriction endonuclease n=1 Tax=Glaciecola punicea TaxID=56804 RepID=UPI001495811E|nr:LlaJI family restriction endonuclease [Glaciecola punicea]
MKSANVTNAGPLFFLDREPLGNLPLNIASELRLKSLVTLGSQPKCSFVGLLLIDKQSYVFLPRGSNLDYGLDQIAYASKLLKAVDKYGRISRTNIDLMDEGLGTKYANKLRLIRYLLEDYRQNGIYQKRQKVNKLNYGREDWKRTVNKVVPSMGISGQPIYLDVYGSRNRFYYDSDITLIHASVILKLDKSFSWLVTGNLRTMAAELSEYSPPRGAKSLHLALIKGELNQTYSDRDITLLKSLAEYLKGEAGSDATNMTIGLRDFHHCWEHMLSKVLYFTVALNDKLPAPAYFDQNGNVLTANSKSMRTDIIIHHKSSEKCAVVDAKYYAATSLQNAPGWGDIVKQLFYEKALRQLDIDWDIRNVFLFPGNSGYLSKALIRDRVKSQPHKNIFLDEFPPIYCHYVDPKAVVFDYVNGSKMKALTEELMGNSIGTQTHASSDT